MASALAHLVALAPGNRDARVIVVDLRSAERDVLGLVLHHALGEQLVELLGGRLDLRRVLRLIE